MALDPRPQRVQGLPRDGSLNALVEMEFDSYMSWRKAVDDPKTKDVMTKTMMHAHDLCWSLWDKSPIVPEPLKPKK